jgi:hypothetical protein
MRIAKSGKAQRHRLMSDQAAMISSSAQLRDTTADAEALVQATETSLDVLLSRRSINDS